MFGARTGGSTPAESGQRVIRSLAPAPVPADERRELASLEWEEHLANLLRLRLLVTFGMIIWVLYGAVEWLVADNIVKGVRGTLLVIRLLLIPIGVWYLSLLYRKEPLSPAELRTLDRSLFVAFTAAVSIMAVVLDGWAGPYFAGIAVVMGCRGAVVAEPWRQAVVSNLLQSLSYFVILGLASLLMDELAAQLSEPGVQAHVAVSVVSLGAITAINVWGGHMLWAFRRRALGSGWLAQYRLDREIGRGGMGVVWAAHHTGLRRDVAVKVLRSDQFDGALTHRRFEREVAVVSQLVSPHTVRIFDYGVDEQQRLYFAMELLEGRNAAQAVEATGPLAPARVLAIAQQLAGSLAEAHAKGIVHRDVKPENVFLTRNGSDDDFVKLLDFGLARLVEGQGTRLTRAGAIVGTPQYFPPEIGYGAQADPRSDVYSAGASLYFMLTGRPPFDAEGTIALLLAHANTPVTPPSQLLLEPIPPELEAIVLRCLAKDPAERFADGAALGAALAGCAGVLHEAHRALPRPA